MGYTKIAIKISMSVREIDDGYQYIAIYNGSSSSAKQLRSTKFEHGSSKDTSTWTHNFTYNLSLDDLVDSKFYIRYDASGAFSDDWVNKNLNIQITVSQK